MEFDPVTDSVIKHATSAAVKLVVDACSNFRFFGRTKEVVSDGCRSALENHLQEVLNWAEGVHFFGMPAPRDTRATTVPLVLSGLPRKFRALNAEVPDGLIWSETEFLNDPSHAVLLGDPGAGKTTTIKRLVLQLLRPESGNNFESIATPICLRLRSSSAAFPLHCLIARVFGIQYAPSQEDDRLAQEDVATDVRDAVVSILNKGEFMVFLDGLDEIDPSRFSSVCSQIVELSLRLTNCKVIVSCRSGAYQNALTGFSTLELNPLSNEQITEVATHWLGSEEDACKFQMQAESSGTNDLLDRPLYLAQLLAVFQNTGYLPQQPNYLARRIVLLMLEGWDSKRSIFRPSMYSNFDAENKLDFLSCLAFELLSDSMLEFDNFALRNVYERIHNKFSLPKNEAEKVANELEAHTGLIVEAGYDKWAFSHLSLQEYLAANYIVRSPFNTTTCTIASSYPEVVAVAVALSSNPTEWLVSLVYDIMDSNSPNLKDGFRFATRLAQEKPRFTISSSLGACVMRFLLTWDLKPAIPLLAITNVRESVALVLPYYGSSVVKGQERVFVRENKKFQLPPRFREDSFFVKSGYLELLIAEFK
jgi:predicted NACHT family NTPase